MKGEHSRRLVLTTIGIFLILGMVMVPLRVSTDLQAFFPDTQSDPLVAGTVRELLRRGEKGNLVVARLGPGERSVLEAVGRKLKSAWDGLEGVDVLGPNMSGRAGLIGRYRFLLIDDPGLDQEALTEWLARQINILRVSPDPGLTRQLTRDPTGTLARYLMRASPVRAQHAGAIWTKEGDPYGYLLLYVEGGTVDAASSARALESVRARAMPVLAGTAMSLELAGPPVLAAEARALIRGRAQMVGAIASVSIVAILWFVYRRVSALMYIAIPGVAAIAAAAQLTEWVFGAIHGITLAFGATILGIVADYPIHAMSHGSGSRLAPTLLLGALTTAGAYGVAFTATGIPALDQLGVFAVAGVLSGIAMTLWMWHAMPPATARMITLPRLRPAAAWVALVVVFGGLTLLWLTADVRWTSRLSALSPIPPEMVVRHNEIRAALGLDPPRHVLAIPAATPEQALSAAHETASQMRAAGCTIRSASDILPPAEVQRRRQRALPDGVTLRARMEQSAEQMGLALRMDAFEPFLSAVEAARSLPPLTPGMLAGTVAGRILGSMLFPVADRWVALVFVADPECLVPSLTTVTGVEAVALDLDAEMAALGMHLGNVALERLAAGMVLIAGICLLVVRPWRRSGVILLALPLAVAGALGLQLVLDSPLSMIHFLGLLVVTGLVLDYALILGRCTGSEGAWDRACHGVLVGATTTLVTFLLLASTGLPVLVALGTTVASGVGIGAVMAWLAVAALIPDRRTASSR